MCKFILNYEACEVRCQARPTYFLDKLVWQTVAHVDIRCAPCDTGVVDPLYGEFGIRLRDARRKAGITQAELGQRVGLSRTSITNIEYGRQRVTLDGFVQLAEAVGADPVSFLTPPLLQKPRISLARGQGEPRRDQALFRRVVSQAVSEVTGGSDGQS